MLLFVFSFHGMTGENRMLYYNEISPGIHIQDATDGIFIIFVKIHFILNVV